MNNFQQYIIDKIDNLLNEGKTISNIINNLEDIFNLNNDETVKELFNNYCIDIMNYYLEEVKNIYTYYTENLKELIQDTFINFVQWYYGELILNEEE